MEIKEVKQNKRQYLDLLLLADEEALIDGYLERGDLFALYDGDLKCVCVVTAEADGVFELQNLATCPQYRRQGYGAALVRFLFEHYRGRGKTILVGTGDSPLTVPFYESCGFVFSYRVENYFLQHYSQPVIENGRQLFDKVYLKKTCEGLRSEG